MDTPQQGKLLSWKEIKAHAPYIQQEGIKQFINLYRKVKDKKAEPFIWGDEVFTFVSDFQIEEQPARLVKALLFKIEYILIKVDEEKKAACVLPKNTHVLPQLIAINENMENSEDHGSTWMPEYGSCQLESTPGRPFGSRFSEFNSVETNMKQRRRQVKKVLDGNCGEFCLTITQLPRFGCPNSFDVHLFDPGLSEITQSVLYPDTAVTPLSRYIGSEVNIRNQRGEHVSINVPVFKDTNTRLPFRDNYSLHPDAGIIKATKDDYIHADSSVAAAAVSCLQITFQTANISQAKYLYDQLIPMCPVMLALSASTPIFRGYLSDEDCRWNAYAESMDCRNEEERGLKPLRESKFVIPKSRFDTVSFYLSEENALLNDIVAPYDEEMFHQLVNGGVEDNLACYIANIFIRGPLTLYENTIHQNEDDTGHFYNIFSTNWMSMRLKPPPSEGEIGWRVEFRPMEVQLTDFENAAYVIFIMLLVRTVDKFKLDLTVPISKVDSNMKDAVTRDAVRRKTFFFKENLESHIVTDDSNNNYTSMMSINTIINGGLTEDGTKFPGLIPLINRYISDLQDKDPETVCTVTKYLKLISDRAAGRVKTTARWIRDFVDGHDDYKHDSIVTEKINYDLLKLYTTISEGKGTPHHLEF